MAMFAPAHPGQILEENLEALGVSVAQGATALGVSRQQLHRVINGSSGISPEMAVRLETVIGSTADHWMRMQTAYDLAQVQAKKADLVRGLKKLNPV